EQGVLHRDLKPANVMIDGRGNAKITDFGLAGAADTLSKEDVFSGTPAYMAPEQLAGREVTRKSDIYALGLVLYQLFTGRPAFEGGTPQEISRVRETSRPADPATLIDGLDPSVGDVILRCLERDPRSRPESALAVAAALPGGDPLAAALAAGVTPSPEIVAAAGEEGVLSPRRATVLLAVTGLAILAVAALSGRYQVTAVVPLDKPRDVLIDRARETLEELGTGPEGITDSAFGFDVDTDLRAWLAATDAHDPWELLPRGRPALVRFWYRSSPRRLQPQIAPSRVSWSDPPRTVSGMTAVRLDTLGRLVELERLPPQVAGPEAASVARGDPEWEKLLAAAGLDPSTLRPADPVWSPPFFTDRRAAWVGEIPELPGEEVRVEAAAFQGELVWFRLIGPWTRAERDQGSRVTTAARINQVLGISIFLLVSAIAAWAARRSIRAGRGDLQGATRIALALVVVHLIRWVLVSHHTGHIGAEFGMFVTTSGVWLFQVATVWVLYVALEPYVRRHDPQKIVAWARLLAGRWRDPLVGRDVLVGAAIAALLGVAMLGVIPAKLALGRSPLPFPSWTSIFGGPRYALGNLADLLPDALTGGMFFTFLWLLLYRVARRPWAASVIVVLILATQMATQDPTVLGIGLAAVMAVAFVAVLARFGLLAVVSLGGFVTGLANAPLSLDLSQWQVRGGWLVVAALIAIAIAAWRASQGDRPGAAAGAGR
ncbi:MAG: serine/threonine-protein kinase, partial [Thermoanaerobaculia bacterium]|nr:serine/threonine-protein kinase [Thermoanaerobaculia bacterium]